MKIPDILENAIEEKLNHVKLTELKQYASQLSEKYMYRERTGDTLLNTEIEALAYSIMRMPATYGAVYTALKHTLERMDGNIQSVVDIGAGTGAATWAISELLDTKDIQCFEREQVMLELGKSFMSQNPNLKDVSWKYMDIVEDDLDVKADLVVTSYMLNEIKPEERENVINKLMKSSNHIILIIEPGTPAGFKNIREVQKIAIENGFHIIAPCTFQGVCSLPDRDWCHSIVRMERTKVHKLLKSADLPYEDEKFSYIAISKEKYDNSGIRILRHPMIEKGKITLKVCHNGEIEDMIVTKKDKELFKMVKKKKCGDMI
mgnify:FL=1